MSDAFNFVLSFLQVPPDRQGFIVGLAAIALAGYAIYAVVSITRNR